MLAKIGLRFQNRFPVYCYFYSPTGNRLSEHSNTKFYYTQTRKADHRKYLSTLIAAFGIGTGITLWLNRRPIYAKSSLKEATDETDNFGKYIEGLPKYSSDDVRTHDSLEKRVWVSFRNGVYDITDLVKIHPGGDIIMIAAGGSVEPFWALYAVHKTDHVLQWLEKYRIGNLDAKDVSESIKDMSNPYGNEPRRHVALKPSSKTPFNAEPPSALLVDSFLTPNELFYVRNHLPVPEVDSSTYELEIQGLDVKQKVLSLNDLKKFPKHTITAAIQCGGNRRGEMVKVRPVKGLNWGQAAISNAEWSGAKLYDVLKSLGLDENKTKALHIQFDGLDLDPTNNPYGASIPIEKAMNPREDVLLAYEMNGEPLSRDHGFPVRVVVPGAVGARHVKWLGRIVVSDEESPSHWQQNDYKGFPPNINWDTVDFTQSPAIQDMPVTSAICVPSDAQTAKVVDGKIKMRGYAYSGGGRKIIRVDVSTDGGKNWQAADSLVSDTAKHPYHWGWTLWSADVPVKEGAKEVTLVAKAVDSSYNTQPESFHNIWNLRGVLSNAYHIVKVKLNK